MKRRIRVRAVVDRDAASPDSIMASHAYLISLLFERAEFYGVAIDWNSYRTYNRRDRRGDLVTIARARAL